LNEIVEKNKEAELKFKLIEYYLNYFKMAWIFYILQKFFSF
jgi:hypothetical protein